MAVDEEDGGADACLCVMEGEVGEGEVGHGVRIQL
jgi:hypothetical protein